jgi:hypothetical protein
MILCTGVACATSTRHRTGAGMTAQLRSTFVGSRGSGTCIGRQNVTRYIGLVPGTTNLEPI